jgi:hypothetical protein
MPVVLLPTQNKMPRLSVSPILIDMLVWKEMGAALAHTGEI